MRVPPVGDTRIRDDETVAAPTGYGTTVEPMVGKNWHCFSLVVT